MKQYIVDTNFILRYLLADNKEQYKQTKIIFDEVKIGKLIIQIPQTVFVEVIFVMLSFYDVPKKEIIDVMKSLLSYKGISNDSVKILNKALYIYANNNIHIVDSLIIAESKLSNLPVLSFDKKLKNILH